MIKRIIISENLLIDGTFTYPKYFYQTINPLASPSARAPAIKYGDVNTVTPSLAR